MYDECYHCHNPIEYADSWCEDGFGLPHCDECAKQCDLCDAVFCIYHQNELTEHNGLLLCESCFEQEKANEKTLADKIIASIEIPGYWYAGRQETDEATTLEFISSDDPKVLVQILRKSA